NAAQDLMPGRVLRVDRGQCDLITPLGTVRADTDAVQIHGAVGCSDGHPANRLFRDAKIMEIIEGSSQIQEILIAQHALTSAGAGRPRTPEGGAS
ncbi:acyl-CoA dehydrogenase family protein, partial [Streptomyces sp. NPDC059853]|uniref:acyl-CoA dehydrogenase family protein n=1 Tax=Streptomyces sp. NPDC059853 TaxID=3346973 RepID=UPI003669FFB3